VLVADTSKGMLEVASGRLPGRVVLASGERLPFGDGSVDVVLTVWSRRSRLSFIGATSFSGRSAWGSATDGDPVFPLVAFRKQR
jgi:hypothetical protein